MLDPPMTNEEKEIPVRTLVKFAHALNKLE